MGQTTTNIYNNVSYGLRLNTDAIARLQEQVSTGARVNRASDDPSAAYNILTLSSQERSLQNYIDNLSDVIDAMGLSSAIIGNITSYLAQVKSTVTQVTSGTYDQQTRERTAEGIDDILEQIVSLTNTKRMNQYIFGGADTTSAPYVIERTNGEISGVTYQGSSDGRDIEVSPGLKASASYVGNDIFSSSDRGDPVFMGTTGAKAGTGTSSVRGDVWLTVINDGANFKLSIDDGASYVTVPPGGDTNQAVTDSRTGQVMYIDTTGINSTGVELVRIPGTCDVFSTLISIRDILKNKKNLSDSQLRQLQDSCLSSLDEVRNLMTQDSVSVGSKIGFLDDLKESLNNLKFNAEDETARLQDADIAQLAIDLSRRQALYQASLLVAAKIMSMTLLDFISTSA
jgi:flagellar hook-associated protein 3 FlgL